ncbi:MAG: hypothetical protein HOP29_06765 [Phycisphaerales bacterium]|nr:hypothetical protein [Phycisphaerales bacterium]
MAVPTHSVDARRTAFPDDGPLPGAHAFDPTPSRPGSEIHLICGRLLSFWCAALIVGTLLPFTVDAAPWDIGTGFGLGLIGWPPSPASDVLTNLAIYVPLGGLLARFLVKRSVAKPVSAAVAVFAAGVLSTLLEWTQTAIPSRVASWYDVTCNVGGAAGGVLVLAVLSRLGGVRRRLRTAIADRPMVTAAKAMTVALCVYHLVPFDLVTSTEALRHTLARTRLWPIFGLAPIDMDETRLAVDSFAYAAQFLLLGLVAAGAQRERGLTPIRSAARAFIQVAAVAFAIEISQIFVASHALDAVDFLAAVGGGFVGAGIATVRGWAGRAVTIRLVASGAIAVQALYLALSSTMPFEFDVGAFDIRRLGHWPLATLFHRPTSAAAADFASLLAIYGSMAVALRVLFCHRGFGRPFGWLFLAPVPLMAAACEFVQLFTPTRVPDVTPPLVALVVVLLVAAWNPPAALPGAAFARE